MSTEPLVIHLKTDLTLRDVLQVAKNRRPVILDPDCQAELQRRRDDVVRFVEESKTQHYGFNRGFGHNANLPVSPAGTGLLQTNLIRSHACGLGAPAPREVVRATMLLRAVSLARGHSGVRPLLIERLCAMLNEDIVPVVPQHGSVGASGDLAPLSHIALAMIGEGQVNISGKGEPVASEIVFSDKTRWPPIALEMKEGLALNNGVQYSTALGFIALDRIRTLLENAALVTALSAQVMLGADTPFLPALHDLRPHPGARRMAGWIWQLMQRSPIREFHRKYDVDEQVQDPYNLRCAAQILGACTDLVDDAERTLLTEANSVTDNPIVLKLIEAREGHIEKGQITNIADRRWQYVDIVSGGHFHGMPVAVRLYGMMQAIAIMARLSNMRAARYVDEDRNRGLGSDLKWMKPEGLSKDLHAATSSAMMIPEYVSAALTNWIWGACMPTHLFSISTDAGQEDHVSMSAGLAVRLLETLPQASRVLAIEFAFAAQAAAIRREQKTFPSKSSKEKKGRKFPKADRALSPPSNAVLTRLWEVFPPVKMDRSLTAGLDAIFLLVEDGTLVRLAADRLDPHDSSATPRFPSWNTAEQDPKGQVP